MVREIPENDVAILRTMCGLPATEPLPEKVQSKYWANKIVCDRVGQNVRGEFVRIAIECGFGKLTEREANPDIATLWYRREIKSGHPVTVTWHEKKLPGKLLSVDATRNAMVLIEGQERLVKAECVTLQSAA